MSSLNARSRAAHVALPVSEPQHDAESLIANHMALVRRIAWHVHGRVSSASEVEDLIQTGMIALVEAARHYRDQGHAFSTYATLRVRGAMIDSLRRGATQCRSAMSKRRVLAKARTQFEQTRGRSPCDDEMASAMGMSLSEYIRYVEAAQSVRQVPIDEHYSDHLMAFAEAGPDACDVIEMAQSQSALAKAIAQLPTREATILQLYFVDELNLDEIGATLKVGAARVCQIKKVALKRLRTLLEE